jgi:predicted DNA-binding protein (UPF0251 family)
MRRCRGRPKCPRRVEIIPSVNYFKPRGIPLENLKVIELSVVELEALRLVDLLGLEQDSAATKMGISRRAFWNELTNARMKVTKALVNGCAIKIEGGEYTMVKRKFVCLKCENEWSLPFGGGRPEKCPKCGSKNFHRYTDVEVPQDKPQLKLPNCDESACMDMDSEDQDAVLHPKKIRKKFS